MINESGYDSFLADSTAGIAANRRVMLVSGSRRITLAGATDVEIAVTKVAVTNNTTPVECRLVNGGGTVNVQTSGAVVQGDLVDRAADGMVVAGASGSVFGVADESVTDDVAACFPR